MGMRNSRFKHLVALIAALLMFGTSLPALAAEGAPSGVAAGWEDASTKKLAAEEEPGSVFWIAHHTVEASDYWDAGFTGAGVDIALIDTGVAPVKHVNAKTGLFNGPDLSFESQADDLRYTDNNGHGTHLAGIMAGRHGEEPVASDSPKRFLGIAPDSRVLNVKAGSANGAVDVSQVIAAIEWVVEHKQDNGLNIRVLNLAYGTDGVQSWETDPLAYAVQNAWDAGIVVVVAAGNDGNDGPLRNPATNPSVIAVGSSTNNATPTSADDHLSAFSSCGTTARPVDVLAPGKSIVSLRAPGSYADVNYPEARIGKDFFVGSGTSQSAAVVSGAAALIIDQRPDISPDEVKSLLTSTAQPLSGPSPSCQGGGVVNLGNALNAETPSNSQSHGLATGLGTLEGARGSAHVALNGHILEGEQDIFGNSWIPCGSATTSLTSIAEELNDAQPDCKTAATSHWQEGGYWNGAQWTGVTWSGVTWSSVTWSGVTWSGVTWSGVTWSGVTWSGVTWSGDAWN